MRQRAMLPDPTPADATAVVKLTWPIEQIHAVIDLAREFAHDPQRLKVEAGRRFGLQPGTTYQFFTKRPDAHP